MNHVAFWDKAAPKYAKNKISDVDAYVATRSRIEAILQPHHRVLELGCGTGSTALELANRVDRYIGTDFSTQMIAIAQSKLAEKTLPHLSFAVQNQDHLRAGKHDVILALNLLHLVPDLELFLSQIYQALPSGGLYIAKTGLLGDGAWILRGIIPVMRAVGKAPYVRCFRGSELLEMLRDTGFDMTETLQQDGIAPRLFTVARKP